MRNKKLVALLILLTVLVTGHNVDHILRDGLPLRPSWEWLAFIVVVTVIYTAIGLTFFLYWKHKIGPRFFTMAALVGLGFGWLGHFSPFTDQPPSYILNAYKSVAAGWVALSLLLALMLTLAIMAVYGGYLWMRDKRLKEPE